jgi:hypothetical protein
MQGMFAYWINIPWPIMVIVCSNHMYALSIIHIFVQTFPHCLYHYFNQAISFKMIMKSNLMVNQILLTQLLKFFSKFHALIHEYFY